MISPDILEHCGVVPLRLPELVEPCTDIGPLTRATAETPGLDTLTTVNGGTWDHCAGMIGAETSR